MGARAGMQCEQRKGQCVPPRDAGKWLSKLPRTLFPEVGPTGMVLFHAQSDFSRPVRHWPRRVGLVVGLLVVVLLTARLMLPHFLKSAINRRLEAIPAYSGRVDAVGLSLFRGAYTMRGLQLEKREAGGTRPFFAVDELDFSLVWSELLRGRVVSEVQSST